jgi:Pyruvate/2-oxoacid:ferredoxin oxidoreductase delta subunit
LAAVLTHRPVELLMTSQGAVIPPDSPGRCLQRIQDGTPAAVALAKRNIRSLLCHSRDTHEVCDALQTVLTAPPRDAEDALEDASLEMNLRFCLFATLDAALLMDGRTLVITDGTACPVRIERRNLRSEGGEYFGPDALARLAAMDLDELRLSPGAISPVWMQLEAGGIMAPDTAHHHLHKGGWRSVRKPDFIKSFCVACGRCFIHCPDNAIIHAAYDKHAKATTGILGVDTERCTACGLCAAVCPTNRDGYKAMVMIEAEAESSAQAHCVG